MEDYTGSEWEEERKIKKQRSKRIQSKQEKSKSIEQGIHHYFTMQHSQDDEPAADEVMFDRNNHPYNPDAYD